jgi:hypothetical protein
MRSTRGKSRKDAHAGISADRMAGISAPLHSNTDIARRLGNSGRTNLLNSNSRGWRTPSMNYRAKEGAGQ